MTAENLKQSAMAIALDIAKKRGLINTEENKMTEENETKVTETKKEIINKDNLEDVLMYAIECLLNKDIEHQAAQVITGAVHLIHMIREAKKGESQKVG